MQVASDNVSFQPARDSLLARLSPLFELVRIELRVLEPLNYRTNFGFYPNSSVLVHSY